MINSDQACEIGDRVDIDTCEGVGGPAVVVDTRTTPGARYKVRLDDGSHGDFWAHDFEVEKSREPTKDGYDSRPDTREHIHTVRGLLKCVMADLARRSACHDASKLLSPEVEVFDEFTPKLKGSTYGSDEYKQFLAAMKPTLDHHYANNAGHHPEGNPDGIRGMSLVDLTEMLCDWLAATRRHADGDIRRSIEINQKRFGYSDELKQIFLNTLPLIETT